MNQHVTKVAACLAIGAPSMNCIVNVVQMLSILRYHVEQSVQHASGLALDNILVIMKLRIIVSARFSLG